MQIAPEVKYQSEANHIKQHFVGDIEFAILGQPPLGICGFIGVLGRASGLWEIRAAQTMQMHQQ